MTAKTHRCDIRSHKDYDLRSIATTIRKFSTTSCSYIKSVNSVYRFIEIFATELLLNTFNGHAFL